MYTVVNAFNPREIISIGVMDGNLNELQKSLEIDVKDRLANPLDDIVESTIIRQFGAVTAIDDFSSKGKLEYVPSQVNGIITNYDEVISLLNNIAKKIEDASLMRDKLKNKNLKP